MTAPSLGPSTGEEIANSVTHGLGAVLGIAGFVFLLVAAIQRGSARHITAVVIFGTTLILLYVASTLYHALTPPRAKRVFQILDHSAIYLLIAGTYTPFTLITLRGVWGWSLLAVIWSLAIFGIVFKSVWIHRFPVLSTAVYVMMGWCAIVAIRPLLNALPWSGFMWLLAGGISYTGGVFFYASHRRYAHAVWHLFVLGGSLCHFWAIYRYVVAA